MAFGWLAIAAIVIAAWEASARRGWVDPVFAGKPSGIWHSLAEALSGELISTHVVATITATVIGFACAAVAGMLIVFLLSQSDVWNRIFAPYFTAFNRLPGVALAPLFLLWFGIGTTPKVVLAASLAFFVVFYSTLAGIQSVDKEHLALARSFGASKTQVYWRFVLPSAVPLGVFGTAARLVYAMFGTVTMEMISGRTGLGAEGDERNLGDLGAGDPSAGCLVVDAAQASANAGFSERNP